MSARGTAAAKAAEALVDETRLLFHRLARTAERLHEADGLTAGMRGVLVGLARTGPRTVPQMARARPVSRQHVQTLVNPLLDAGYVALRDNPAHRRSKLVELTRRGREAVVRVERRERKILAAVGVELGDRRLRTAATALRGFREALEARDS